MSTTKVKVFQSGGGHAFSALAFLLLGAWVLFPASACVAESNMSGYSGGKSSAVSASRTAAAAPEGEVLRVSRRETRIGETPVFEGGRTEMEEIPGTSLQYATNTTSAVLMTRDDDWFVCEKGIWFTSNRADGPWRVATAIPSSEIEKIPANHPLAFVASARLREYDGTYVWFALAPEYYAPVTPAQDPDAPVPIDDVVATQGVAVDAGAQDAPAVRNVYFLSGYPAGYSWSTYYWTLGAGAHFHTGWSGPYWGFALWTPLWWPGYSHYYWSSYNWHRPHPYRPYHPYPVRPEFRYRTTYWQRPYRGYAPLRPVAVGVPARGIPYRHGFVSPPVRVAVRPVAAVRHAPPPARVIRPIHVVGVAPAPRGGVVRYPARVAPPRPHAPVAAPRTAAPVAPRPAPVTRPGVVRPAPRPVEAPRAPQPGVRRDPVAPKTAPSPAPRPVAPAPSPQTRPAAPAPRPVQAPRPAPSPAPRAPETSSPRPSSRETERESSPSHSGGNRGGGRR